MPNEVTALRAIEHLLNEVNKLPRIRLLRGPTPIDECPRFSSALGIPSVYIKRDDLAEPLLGGNKARLMEFVLGLMSELEADTVICSAPVGTNLCSTVANVAAQQGLKAVLFLRGKRPERPRGNPLLNQIFGADIKYLESSDPNEWVQAEEAMHAEKVRLEAEGRRCLLLLPGVTRRLAAAAYMMAMQELSKQLTETQLAEPRALYLSSSAGGTHVGTLLGLRAMGLSTRVIAHRNRGEASVLDAQTMAVLADFCSGLGVESLPIDATEIDVRDRYSEAYTHPTLWADVHGAISTMGASEGILLDPHYTGKAVAFLIKDLQEGTHDDRPVMFLHTGGLPGLFSDQYDLSSVGRSAAGFA